LIKNISFFKSVENGKAIVEDTIIGRTSLGGVPKV